MIKTKYTENSIKFSICIPNYNYANYIGKTIQSVLDQSYGNFEIIIADNASTDDSISVVNSFNDDRISIQINNYNIGFAPNLEKATSKATGDFVILLSSDDIMNPGALEEYAKIIQNYNGAENQLIIMSGCDVIDSKGNLIGEKLPMTGDVLKFLRSEGLMLDINKEEYNFEGLYILKGLLSNRFQPAGQFLTTCFSKKLFDKVEGYNSILSVFPDAHFSHKMLFENPLVIYKNKKLFGYRIHNKNNLTDINNMSNIKSLTDCYHLTLLYSNELLDKLNLNDSLLKVTFIKNICILPSLHSLLRGGGKKSFQLIAFAFAAYPLITIKDFKTYILLLLFPLTPMLKIINFIRKLSK